jgi:hypothetical protein
MLAMKESRNSSFADPEEGHIMPNYLVVQCFQCRVFQSQQEKKEASARTSWPSRPHDFGWQARFVCVMCGAAQSIKQVLVSSSKCAKSAFDLSCVLSMPFESHGFFLSAQAKRLSLCSAANGKLCTARFASYLIPESRI